MGSASTGAAPLRWGVTMVGDSSFAAFARNELLAERLASSLTTIAASCTGG